MSHVAHHVAHIVGARPNFMKAAAVYRPLDGRAQQTLIHTGQHYDETMSGVFFQQLGLPRPDFNLNVGSAAHGVQTGEIMIRLEPILEKRRPDVLLVYGDVNSTVAAALVGAKLGIRIGHVEAGLRSRDRTMPEEINRMATDAISDVLFTPSQDASDNLAAEGVASERVAFVGNVMIDTLVHLLPHARVPEAYAGLAGAPFVLVTLHRPSNVDEPALLRRLIDALGTLSTRLPVVFPVHPRTRARMGDMRLAPGLHLVEPLGYLEFLALEARAAVVVTDSGGIQEETTFLGVPCVTVRENTERPVTITHGTNRLVGRDPQQLIAAVDRILASKPAENRVPDLWDGHAGERIAALVAP